MSGRQPSAADRFRAAVLRQAAQHLEEARAYDYASRARRIHGWASAAAELRSMARKLDPGELGPVRPRPASRAAKRR
jgi:hypothetical protein